MIGQYNHSGASLVNQRVPQFVGGYGASNQLPQQVDQFVRSQRPEVSMAQVLNVQRQVVAGINYRITYRNPKGDTFQAVVYDQSWTKTRKLTSFEKLN